MGEYYNTIILRHAEGSYTKKQFKNYSEGDCIYGPNTDPEELKRWTYDQLNEAKAELAKYKCTYDEHSDCVDVEKYALEYCDTNTDGEFVNGSDYDLAEREEV